MAKNIALILAVVAFAALPQADARPLQDAPPPQYPRVPLAFQENRGQFDGSVRFACRTSRATTFLTPAETVLVLGKPAVGSTLPDPSTFPAMPAAPASETAVLRFSLAGGAAPASMVGVDRMACRFNYFSKEGGSVDVPAFRAVRSTAVYPGIDLLCIAVEQGLKYDFDVAPGANPAAIRISISGSESLEIDGAGNLIIRTAIGDVSLPAPVLYQTRNGVRVPVTGAYRLLGSAEVGFIVGDYDPALSLTIDPFLVYSTYLGGTGQEEAHDLALDAAGNAYITGSTMSSDFPTQNPIQGTFSGGIMDAFVAKIDMTNNVLVYATYLGGQDIDWGNGIVVDASGNAVVVGLTASSNFPIQNAYQSTKKPGSNWNAFITKLSPQGNSLIFSTYLGGSYLAFASGVAFDPSGNIYVAGRVDSVDFPVQGAYQSVLKGLTDVFVSKFTPDGSSLLYSTYVGGNGIESCWSLAVDAAGSAYVTVQTDSTDFPMKNAAQDTFLGGRTSGAVFKLNASGNDLVWSTYQGGSGPGSGAATGIALDGAGGVYVTGVATVGFPTLNAYQPEVGSPPFGQSDAFVSKFNGSTGARIYGTFLGSGSSVGHGVAVDGAGNAVFCGLTFSAAFPLQDPFDSTIAGNFEGFVAKIGPGGNTLVFSSYLGGNGDDLPFRVRIDAAGRAVVLGSTGSTDFPVVNPLQSTLLGDRNAFLARIADTQELSLTSTSTTNSLGIAVSSTIQLPIAPETSTIVVTVPGTSVPGVSFEVTTLDGAVAVEIPAPSITEPFSGMVLMTSEPTISGTASAPGLVISLLSNGVPQGSAISGVNGFWSMTPSVLPQGTQALTAYATDPTGNTSPLSDPVTVTVDGDAPVLTTNFPIFETISDSRPTISVRWSDSVTGVSLSSASIMLTDINGNNANLSYDLFITPGGFTLIPTAALPAGTYVLTAVVFDGAGQAGFLSFSFTVQPPPVFPTAGDTTAPEITISSPPDGYILTQPSLLLYATVFDSGGSGLDSSNITLTLNGVLMPASVTLSDSNNATIQLQTTLTNGFYSAVFTARDLAGNLGSASSGFQVTIGGDDFLTRAAAAAQNFNIPPQRPRGIEIVSGNGQSGLTGRAAADPLVVRVFDTSNPATSLSQVLVDFEIISGGGQFSTGPTLRFVTDSAGKAQVKYVIGHAPGANQIRAKVYDDAQRPSVTFTINGNAPSIEVLSDVGPCNAVSSTAEYPGSAMRRLFKCRVSDNNGNRMAGEPVVPQALNFQGDPPASKIGEFMPRKGVTDANGEVTFAFVIDLDAPIGSFLMRFPLPRFFGSDNEPISDQLAGQVLNPANKPRNLADTEINFDDPSRSGQSQIGIPNQRIGTPLRGRFFAPGNPNGGGTIIFSILEGDGTFEPGPEGTLAGTPPDPFCGKLRMGMQCVGQPESGVASVYFKLAPGNTHALIAMDGFTDIFAIGPPEVGFVSAADPNKDADFVVPTDEPQSQSNEAFRFEVRMPVGTTTPSMTGRVRSFDQAEDPISSESGTGQEVVDVNLTPEAAVNGKYIPFRSPSGSPLIAYISTNANLSGFTGIRTVGNGDLLPTVVAPSTIQGAPAPAPLIEKFRIYHVRDPLGGGLVLLRITNVGNAQKVVWNINKPAGPGSHSGDATKATAPFIWIKLGDAWNLNGPKGTSTDPIEVQMSYQAGNLRDLSNLILTATINNKALPTVIVRPDVGNSGPLKAATEQIPETDEELTDKFPFWKGSFEPEQANVAEPGRFIPLPENDLKSKVLRAVFDRETGSDNIVTNRRLVYSNPSTPALQQKLQNNLGLCLSIPMLKLNAAGTELILEHSGVLGSAIHPSHKTDSDLADLSVTVEHETNHAKHSFAMDLAPGHPQFNEEGKLLKAVTLNVANKYFTAVPADARTEKTRTKLQEVCGIFQKRLDEVLVGAKDISTIISKAPVDPSHSSSHDSVLYFASNWAELLELLHPDASVPLVAVRENDTEVTVNLKLDGQARTDVITRLQKIYDELPGYLKELQGGDYTFLRRGPGPGNNVPDALIKYKSLIQPSIMRPTAP